MNIIAVNRFYWPDHSATSQMLTDLARHLASHGHNVTVIASRLRYEGGTPLKAQEVVDGVLVKRVLTTGFGRSGLVGRFVDYLTFYVFATCAVLSRANRGDVVIVKTDPPLLSTPITLLRSMKGYTIVNWCQDLFPETAAVLGMRWAGGGIGATVQKLRNWTLRQASFNAVLNAQMAARLRAAGVDTSQTRILENWADADIRSVPHVANPLRKNWRLGDAFVIGYSGNLGRAHMPEKIAELVRRTKDIPGVAWLFIGGGAGLGIVRKAAAGSSNVHFKPYQPRELLSQSLSAADAHLISLDPACEGYVAPSKLYGVLAAGRPVIFLGASTGQIGQHVAGSGDGCVLAPHEPENWATSIVALQKTLERRAHLTRAPRPTLAALEDWRIALESARSEPVRGA